MVESLIISIVGGIVACAIWSGIVSIVRRLR